MFEYERGRCASSNKLVLSLVVRKDVGICYAKSLVIISCYLYVRAIRRSGVAYESFSRCACSSLYLSCSIFLVEPADLCLRHAFLCSGDTCLSNGNTSALYRCSSAFGRQYQDDLFWWPQTQFSPAPSTGIWEISSAAGDRLSWLQLDDATNGAVDATQR